MNAPTNSSSEGLPNLPVPKNVGCNWPIPKNEIRERAAQLLPMLQPYLLPPGEVVELRALEVPKHGSIWCDTGSGYYTDHLELVTDAFRAVNSGAKGVYVTANTIDPTLLARRANRAVRCKKEDKTTANENILRRRRLLIDIDAKRASGISASDGEKQFAYQLMQEVLAHLSARGWPDPFLADSPNGYHAIFAIDLPVQDGGLVEGCLKALAARFSNGAVLDTSVHKPAQLLRLPGTPGRKGDSLPDRPHRTGGVLLAPKEYRPVPQELMQALAAELPSRSSTSVRSPDQRRASMTPASLPERQRARLDVGRWLTDRGVAYSLGPERPDGRTVYRLDHCPFNFEHRSPDASILQNEVTGALGAHCFHQSCRGKGWKDFKAAIGKPQRQHYDLPLSASKVPTRNIGLGKSPESRQHSNSVDHLNQTAPGTASQASSENHQEHLGSKPDIQLGPQGIPASPSEESEATPSRRQILIDTDEYRVNAEALLALASEPDLFRRGSTLVVLCQDDDLPVLRQLEEPVIQDRLSRIVQFCKWEGKGENAQLVPAHPPQWCVRNIRQRTTDFRGMKSLQTVVNHPLFLSDGSLLTRNGYHAPGGILLLSDCHVQVPESPTLADAQTAVAKLLEIVEDFPFVTPADRSAWLAAVITPFAHAAYTGPAPLFWIDKTTPGIGGSKLIHLVTNIATGRDAPLSTYTHDLAETRKLLTALSLSCPQFLVFDNVEGRFGNAALSLFLTGTNRSDRILGTSNLADGTYRPISLASSNNGQLVADMHRRVLPIRLACSMEQPELRSQFRHPKLIAHVRQIRSRLQSAALTILRAWHVAGRPTHGLPAFGSFDDWSDLVREAIVFTGAADPAETRVASETLDPQVNAIATIIGCWSQLDPELRGLTAAKIADRIVQAREETMKQPDWMDALIEAAEELCAGNIIASRIGYAFRKFRGRIFQGWCLEEAGSHAGVKRWVVRPRQCDSVGDVLPSD